MVAVGWLIGVVVVMAAFNYATIHTLLRANGSLTRALIATNPKELAMLDKAATPTRRKPAPEVEGQFTEPKMRPLGLG